MSADGDDFRKIHFKSPDAVDRRWLEWFREEFSRQLYRIDIEPSADAPFELEATSRLLPDLGISVSTRSPMRASHRGDVNDEINVVVLLDGQINAQYEHHDDVVMTPGTAVLGRNGIVAVLDMPSKVKMLSLRLRRQLLNPLVEDLSDLRDIAVLRDSQALRLLLGYVRMLDGEQQLDSSETRRLVTTHVHELVALAYGATADARHAAEHSGVRAARRAAHKADKLANLHRSDLTATAVAARLGMTRRHLYRLLDTEGASFSEYVIGKRLARAHVLLSEPRHFHRSISAIAFSVGFGDLSYFNRTFRHRYGETPSDVRQRARLYWPDNRPPDGQK
jgi:AraC-like DNA-binding protein